MYTQNTITYYYAPISGTFYSLGLALSSTDQKHEPRKNITTYPPVRSCENSLKIGEVVAFSLRYVQCLRVHYFNYSLKISFMIKWLHFFALRSMFSCSFRQLLHTSLRYVQCFRVHFFINCVMSGVVKK